MNCITKQIHSDGKKRRSFVALLFAAGVLRRYERPDMRHGCRLLVDRECRILADNRHLRLHPSQTIPGFPRSDRRQCRSGAGVVLINLGAGVSRTKPTVQVGLF